jgi:hypothetical protein
MVLNIQVIVIQSLFNKCENIALQAIFSRSPCHRNSIANLFSPWLDDEEDPSPLIYGIRF